MFGDQPFRMPTSIMLKGSALILFCLALLTPEFKAASNRDHLSLVRKHWRPRTDARVHGNLAARYHDGCLKEHWVSQPIDHFHFQIGHRYKQRYFICDKYFAPGGPVFFYAGNEADVMLYVNATGLIWENAEEFQALVVFAEHRYYGSSQPFGVDSWKTDPTALTTEQAMADFAHLVYGIKSELGIHDSPVIAFGGSYGGMLAAWLRMKYPLLFQGAIAASAPIGAFPGSRVFKPYKFWEVVTQDATAAAGAPEGCSDAIRAGFSALFGASEDAPARAELAGLLRLCQPVLGDTDVLAAAYWLQGAFDAYAMGNFPYESSYISGDPEHPLPAWPMRAACSKMPLKGPASPVQLLEGLREAVGLLYNASGAVQCYDTQPTGPAAGNTGPWDYQFCTELDGQEQPYYPANGVTDMFWDQGTFDLDGINQHCMAAWNITPRVHHAFVQFGGVEAAQFSSNIIFSNGLLDPWSTFGVMENITGNPSIIAVTIPNGAHHVDLMFSNPGDTPDILTARQIELAAIRGWIQQYKGLGFQ